MTESTLIVTAYSKAPQNTAMYENNKYMGLVLEIHKESHIVIDVEVTVMTDLVKKYFKKLIIGTNFSNDITPLITEIENNYIAPSQNALIVALKVAHQRYRDNCLTINNSKVIDEE